MTLGITISYDNFWTFSFYEHIEIYTENRLLTAPYKIDKIAVKFLILDFSDPPCSKLVVGFDIIYLFISILGTGPLLDMAIRINPGLIPNAFLLSSMVFACFSGAALFAPNGSYLYLGGSLLSGLSTMFWLGFLNLFFQSQLIFQVHF